MVQTTIFATAANSAARTLGVAQTLAPEQRQALAVQALAGSFTITALAGQTHVSRKFVYQQMARAQQALDEAFAPAEAADDTVLAYLPVTKRWRRMVVLALLLLCRSSFRGVQAFCRDCLDFTVSLGTIHNILGDAVEQARPYNAPPGLQTVVVGLFDELFQAGAPVLVGVDAASTYCFLLSQEDNRDAVTWGVRLLELQERGLHPQACVADFGTGLRAGHALVWPEVPCRGDVFHALQTLVPVVSALEEQAYRLLERCVKLERQSARCRRRTGAENRSLGQQLRNAKPAAARAVAVADDVALLVRWLHEDVLAVAGPSHAQRQHLYDFLVAELRARVPACPARLAPVCRFLENHRDQLLAFAAALDGELAALAADFAVPVATVRELLHCQALSSASARRWQREALLRQQLGQRFYALRSAVADVAAQTVRASSAVENLNSRLRNYFTLRRHLGNDYLALLQFFLNHHRFDRSERSERVGKSPAELLTGQKHPHWLALLGYAPFRRN